MPNWMIYVLIAALAFAHIGGVIRASKNGLAEKTAWLLLIIATVAALFVGTK